MADIKVTLETLYDILRNEKKKEDLQELESSFFVDVVAYLREKKALLEQKGDQDELFASTEREKLEYELRSIKRILKEIYEKREKKLIDIAMNKSRTRSDIIDVSCMLREEKEFFDSLVNHLNKYRSGVLLNLFKGNLPFVDKDFSTKSILEKEAAVQAVPEPVPEKEPEKEESSANNSFNKYEGVEVPAPDTEVEEESEAEESTNSEASEPETKEEKSTPEEKEEKEGEETPKPEEGTPLKEQEPEKTPEPEKEKLLEPKTKPEEKEAPKQDMTKIKFVHPVPKFIWKDMKEYGPFDPGEETEIFPEVADLLVRKGRAEKV